MIGIIGTTLERETEIKVETIEVSIELIIKAIGLVRWYDVEGFPSLASQY